MRLPLLLLATALAWPLEARAADRGGDGCTIEAGPDDLVAQDADLVVPAGAAVKDAIALRGNVVVERGARVAQVVAAGGSVTVRAGAVVSGDVVAIGGDVRLRPDARVEGDAVALGGQVRLEPGSAVRGDVTSLAFRLAGADLARAIGEAARAIGPCRVVAAAGHGPEEGR
jgi:hypothetical protein